MTEIENAKRHGCLKMVEQAVEENNVKIWQNFTNCANDDDSFRS